MATYNFTKPPINEPIFEFDKIPYEEPVPVLRKFYFHRAWNQAQVMWETWTSLDEASPLPPSGDPISGLTMTLYWRIVV